MERKIIKQGLGGYTVYLPKKWVEDNKLDKGDELNVSISGKDLIFSPKSPVKKSETEINLKSDLEVSIRSIISTAYRVGYDRIKINLNNEKQQKIVQDVIKNKLIGFDIIKREKDFCIAENITEPSEDQFDNILKKFFMNIEELYDITKKRLEGKADKELDDYREVEERIQKYDNFCRRIIFKQKLIKKNPELFWSFLIKILHSQREIYFINIFLDKNKNLKFSKEIMKLFNASFDIFMILVDSFYQNNLDNISKIHEMQKDFIGKIVYPSFEKNIGIKNILVYHLIVSIRQLHLSTSSLVGIIV